MPRIARIKAFVNDGVYHVISRTATDRQFDDYERDHLVKVMRRLSDIYFTKVYAYCVMGNHFHLIVQMRPAAEISAQELRTRFARYRAALRFSPAWQMEDPEQLAKLKVKWSDLSEFIKEIKLIFTRWYNARHQRRGFLWGGRFKNVLLEKGEALINCMAYVDMNPVRAGLTKVPEDYRWNSLFHHNARKNKGNWLSLDYATPHGQYKDLTSNPLRLRFYRQYMYTRGSQDSWKLIGGEARAQGKIPVARYKKAAGKKFTYTFKERFLQHSRYFSDSVIIGSREFVRAIHVQVKPLLLEKRKRQYPAMKGYGGLCSMRDLRKDVLAA